MVDQKEYWKVRISERREYIRAYKKERGCQDCGYSEHVVALQFDHVRGTKKAHVSNMLNCSWETLLKEIEKCEVVCANCHHVRTMSERGLNTKF